jgi:hypothetical protein
MLLGMLLLPGCSTIHFDHGPALPPPDTLLSSIGYWFSDEAPPERHSLPPESSLYHHGILSLIEISNPLELDLICTGYVWNRVTTEVTPVDLILGTIDNVVLAHFSSAGIDLWSPWSIEYSCRE